MDQATFSALVSDAIQPYRGMPPTSSGYHVHMAFNGPTTTSEDYACQTHGETANFGGDIHLIAAFCGGSNRAITYLVGSVSGITGPDDPNFAKFVRWAVVELFPPYDDSDQRQSDFCFIPGC